jgi:hypothetical protein
MDEYDNFPPIAPPAPGSIMRNDGTPPQNIEVVVIEKEDDVLQFTQKARQQIVKSLMGKDLNDLNASQLSLLTASLDGMDRSALGRKRLQTDEKIGANNAVAAAIIAKVLSTPGALKAGQVDADATPRKSIPQLPADPVTIETVDGEMEADARQMTYDTFMTQTSGQGA